MIVINFDGNCVEGSPVNSGACSIEFSSGGDNRVTFEEGVRLNNSRITVKGSGNRVVIRARSAVAQGSISICGDGGSVEIGERCVIRGSIAVLDGGKVVIGDRSRFHGAASLIACEGRTIRVGVDCWLADPEIRTSEAHLIVSLADNQRINPAMDITIGDRVRILENVSLSEGASIGSGSVIDENTIVAGVIPENCFAGGIPVRVIEEEITWVDKLMTFEEVAP